MVFRLARAGVRFLSSLLFLVFGVYLVGTQNAPEAIAPAAAPPAATDSHAKSEPGPPPVFGQAPVPPTPTPTPTPTYSPVTMQGGGGILIGITGILGLLLPWISAEREKSRAEERRKEDAARNDRALEAKVEAANRRADDAERAAETLRHRVDDLDRARVEVQANRAVIASQGATQAVHQDALVKAGYIALPPGYAGRDPARPLPTVVIVEDDPAAQAALAGIISARGWSVTPCGSVAEGIAAVDKGPHWLILDLKLPDGDGLAVLRHARANGRGTRTIVTTGAADPAVLRTLQSEAPDHIVMKPVVDIDEIVNLLGAP